MQNCPIDQLTAKFLIERQNGTDCSEIWKKLEIMNVSDEHKRLIMRNIDSQILRENYYTVRKQRANEVFYSGLVLTIFGLFFTLGTYLGLIKIGNSIILLYGPILGGTSLILTGYKIKKRS